MASSSGNEFLKKLEAEVTCPLCLQIYTEPKKLPCEHVYCKQCLHGLASRSTTGTISCPECRTDTPVPPNFDMSQFVTPYRVNRLVEMYWQNLEPEAAAAKPSTCPVHKSQALALYCETCESLVCRDCALLSCAKNNHQHGCIEDMVKKYQTDLRTKLQPVKKLQRQMKTALGAVEGRESEMHNMKEMKLQQTEATFDNLTAILAQERQHSVEMVNQSFAEQEDLNSSKKSVIKATLSKLESIIGSTQKFLAENDPATEFLKSVPEMKESINQAVKEAEGLSPVPAPLSDMQVQLVNPSKFKDFLHVNNFTHKVADPLKCHLKRSTSLHNLRVPINKESACSLYVDPDGVEKVAITAHLQCLSDGSSGPTVVRMVTPDEYSLSFTPRKRGRHKLHITHNSTHIFGSPAPIYVTIEPQQLRQSLQKRVDNARGIKCYGGKTYVTSSSSDSGLRIYTCMSRFSAPCKVISLPGLANVLVTKENIYATAIQQNRLVKMDMNGFIVKCVGEDGEFKGLSGIRQSPNGFIYVCDTHNHRIQVFDEDLNFLTSMQENFNKPSDLDEAGNLYVVNRELHRIQVLTPDGKHIQNIGRKGIGPGGLDHPLSLAIYNNMVYVADCGNNRISVFKTTGEFVTTFGEGLIQPASLDIDEDGYVYVTSNRKLITVF